MSILDFTPAGYELREGQKKVLLAFERAYLNGTRYFMIDAPVGSGKSLIVRVMQAYLQVAYVLTPRLGLQAQYTLEFTNSRKLIGRRHYPCSYQDSELNNYVIPIIKNGKTFRVEDQASCSGAICTKKPAAKRQRVMEECLTYGPCPYTTAIDVASQSDMVVCNYHSFIAQTRFRPDQFGHRKLLAIDESHTLASVLRDVLTVSFIIDRMVAPKEVEHLKTLAHWVAWLQRSEQLSTFHDADSREAHLARVEQLEQTGEGVYGTPVITKLIHDSEKESFKVSVIPYNVGGAAQKLIYDYADVVVVLSGTWYDKNTSCREIGLDPALTNFISVASEFPAKNREVVLPPSNLDLSHKNWELNLPKLAKYVSNIINSHRGQSGLIHTSSYTKAWQLGKLLKSPRIILHTSDDFVEKFKEFQNSVDGVLISPSCVEGVDLKDDLCRFNVLTSLPYPSAGEGYFQRLLANNGWNLYNIICMRQIGQALGRGVRHKEDWCKNYLCDTRFYGFLNKMGKFLPDWFKAGFVDGETK